MNNDIYLIGEVGREITLKKVIDLVATTDNLKTLNVHIHSEGGSVYEGKAIYNYLKALPQGCDTFATGMVASIASIIMLAGKNKKVYSENSVLIHLPSATIEGNSSDFKAISLELEKEEIKLAKIYEAETNFTYDEAIALMREDRMMTSEEVVKFGLTIQPYKAVAKYKSTNNNFINMNAKTQKLINAAKSFLGFKNLIVFTADQMELDFYALEEGEVIEIGAKAFFDGADAEGEFVMADGETYVFVAGELTEIKPVEEVEDAEDKDSIIAALEEQLLAMTAKAVDLSNEVKAKESVILNFQAKSKGVGFVQKTKQKEGELKGNNATAIANLRNNLKK